ncbi:MAG: hypothetical protein CM1200mP9_08560 [Gammaproteobacteria bacterium]|nr:MAG: hypothetical protein CM1200mP9_08560 [Gammaproteobacteria bacterium]
MNVNHNERIVDVVWIVEYGEHVPFAPSLFVRRAPTLLAYDFSDEADYLAPAENWPAWHNTMERASQEANKIQGCLQDKRRCERWLRSLHVVVDRSRNLSQKQQLEIVNRYINRHRHYRRDRRNQDAASWGDEAVFSQWSTLREIPAEGWRLRRLRDREIQGSKITRVLGRHSTHRGGL